MSNPARAVRQRVTAGQVAPRARPTARPNGAATVTQQFLLVLYTKPGEIQAMPQGEIQKLMERWQAWAAKLAAAGQKVGGQKLRDEGGKQLARAGGKVAATDGPYAETKELVGGYYLINARNYDDAVAIAAECPHLAVGRIDVRRIDPMDVSP